MWIPPTLTLKNDHVLLEPLTVAHAPELAEAVEDGQLYQQFWTSTPTPEGLRADIEGKLKLRDTGHMMPFAIRTPDTGEALGVTTFYALQPEVPRLEIGYTWIRESAQGSAINPNMKLLMLEYAFEVLECEAVGIRTKWMNRQSRAAIEKLGLRRDGIIRANTRHRDGTLDDAVLYSAIKSEWPALKSGLAYRLAQF